jgi:propionaldehyde dehydrogenase
MMHSHDVVNLTKMAQAMNCSIFVKNGPCYAGLGSGGAGFTSFTIASPTGEGITRARTFTRERRCALVDSFRII